VTFCLKIVGNANNKRNKIRKKTKMKPKTNQTQRNCVASVLKRKKQEKKTTKMKTEKN